MMSLVSKQEPSRNEGLVLAKVGQDLAGQGQPSQPFLLFQLRQPAKKETYENYEDHEFRSTSMSRTGMDSESLLLAHKSYSGENNDISALPRIPTTE